MAEAVAGAVAGARADGAPRALLGGCLRGADGLGGSPPRAASRSPRRTRWTWRRPSPPRTSAQGTLWAWPVRPPPRRRHASRVGCSVPGVARLPAGGSAGARGLSRGAGKTSGQGRGGAYRAAGTDRRAIMAPLCRFRTVRSSWLPSWPRSRSSTPTSTRRACADSAGARSPPSLRTMPPTRATGAPVRPPCSWPRAPRRAPSPRSPARDASPTIPGPPRPTSRPTRLPLGRFWAAPRPPQNRRRVRVPRPAPAF